MTYDRFKEIWPQAAQAAKGPILHNGVSQKTVAALVAVAEGNHSEFDEIQKQLADFDSRA